MSSEIASRLSFQAENLVSRFEDRVNFFTGRADLCKLMRELDVDMANAYAREYLGEGEHIATGIDGSMGYDERLQMMLFYANATAYSCPFRVNRETTFDLKSARRESRLTSSAAIPLWSEDFQDVLSEYPEIDLELEHSMERIPNAFMTLAELYLALKAFEDSKIIFLDRPISGTYSTLSRDVRRLLKRRVSNLTKLQHMESVSLLDIKLSLAIGSPNMQLPSRFLEQRIIKELMSNDISFDELSNRLSLTDSELARAVKRIRAMDSLYKGTLLSDPQSLKLRDEVRGYWERAVRLATGYAESVFDKNNHPLSISDEEWLSILDVNALSFILLQRLCELAIERRALLIGIAKDTTATDVARAVLPFAEQEGFVKLERPAPRLKNDRAFLTILSSVGDAINTPWRTIGYDSSFSTIISVSQDGERIFNSARKYVSREELFVRGFLQLRSLKNNEAVRSPVFLFDRPYIESEDVGEVRSVKVKERGGLAMVSPYFEGGSTSRLSNLVLYILSLNDNPEVFEAFGHNQLLYLADKAVKAEIRLMKSSLRGVADLRLGTLSKREQIYGIVSSYRERRSKVEEARIRAAKGE
jgi:hypothetical protein